MRSKQQLHQLRKVLANRRDMLRKSLINDIAELKAGTGTENGDAAEVALDDVFDLVSSQLAESESRELDEIETALDRIRRGNYGECSGCGGVIPLARLQALPYANRCVKCERELEQRRRAGFQPDHWSGTGAAEDEGEPNNPFFDHVADIF